MVGPAASSNPDFGQNKTGSGGSGQYNKVHTNTAAVEQREQKFDLSAVIVDPDNEPQWQQFTKVYTDAYFFYKKNQMGLDKNMDLETFLELHQSDLNLAIATVKQAILDGHSIATLVTNNQDIEVPEGETIPTGTPIAFTYGMEACNPLSGRPDCFIEGTYANPDARRGGAATAALSELQAAAKREWNAEGLSWWTFLTNPNTSKGDSSTQAEHPFDKQGMYDFLPNLDGETRADQLGNRYVTNRTAELIATIPLVTDDPQVMTAYAGQVIGNPINPINSSLSGQKITVGNLREGTQVYTQLKKLYKQYRQSEGYKMEEHEDPFAEFLDQVKQSGFADKMEFMLLNQDGFTIGFTILDKQGIKLPRDPYTSMNLRTVFLEDQKKWDQSMSDAVFSEIATQAKQLGHRVVRMTIGVNHPAVPFLSNSEVRPDNNGQGPVVRCKIGPLRTFRLGLTPGAQYAENVPPYIVGDVNHKIYMGLVGHFVAA